MISVLSVIWIIVALFDSSVAGPPSLELALLNWANAIFSQYPNALKGPESSVAVTDYLGTVTPDKRQPGSGGLGDGGKGIATAGKGSVWYYDRVHHIAAATECCEYEGDFISYAAEPPGPLPSKDLSQVRSARGLGLDSTPAEVVAAFHLSLSAITKRAGGIETIVLRRPNPDKRVASGFLGLVVFRNGHAVQIEMGTTHG